MSFFSYLIKAVMPPVLLASAAFTGVLMVLPLV